VCNNEKVKDHNLKIYKIIRENGGWDNWTMLLLEKFPCEDKYQACKRERELYEELGAKMNTLRPYITKEETKQYDKKYDKQYYQIHKAEIKQNNKLYREEHEEEIKKYREEHKEYHKLYYQEHKEKMNEKIECEYCSKLLSKCSMSRHIKTCKSKE
jgi:site-specific DNA-cytosine methylase